MIFLIPIFFLFGLLFGNMNALALTPMGHIAGTASAVIGTTSIAIAIPIGSIIAHYYRGPIDMFIQLIIIISLSSYCMFKGILFGLIDVSFG